MVIHTLVTSHLCYSNLFYMQLPLEIIQKFQLGQNMAILLIKGMGDCYSKITHLLQKLYLFSLQV